ncbi:MAG TPA: hypothetical protein VHU40_04655, partial [Polyangia bacterium]|nr:hypothetical protein [Polyangia bacterium]
GAALKSLQEREPPALSPSKPTRIKPKVLVILSSKAPGARAAQAAELGLCQNIEYADLSAMTRRKQPREMDASSSSTQGLLERRSRARHETCTVNDPIAGDDYVMLRGFTSYSGVTINAVF